MLHWVHGELYTSQAWRDAEYALQNSPPVEGCDLPRAIAAFMFYSDSTNLAQFGNAKAWPIYVFFGNQSKYDRARPATAAGYHVAYLPSVSIAHLSGVDKLTNGIVVIAARQDQGLHPPAA